MTHSGKALLRVLIIIACCIVSSTLGDVKLPAIVSDSMVLQQQTEVNIWGWADPDEKVTISPSWRDQQYTCITGQEKKWRTKIKTPEAGGPYTIKINGKNKIILDNILIGEVWVCSGQSNMEWPLGACESAKEAIPAANYPHVRLFNVERALNWLPQEDCKGRWLLCSPEAAKGFSGVAYFFGTELHKDLQVPIGLISSHWGGTVAQAWTSADGLKTLPDFVPVVEEFVSASPQEKKEAWKRKVCALDEGMQQEWFKPGFDHHSWKVIETPMKWSLDKTLAGFDGLVWFSKDFEVDADMASTDKGFTLELGAIDDMDITWINGQKVGGVEELGFFDTPRKYDVPAGCIKAGKNTIVVRVHDWVSEGGFSGKPEELKLTPVDKQAGTPIALAGSWRYKITVNQKEIPNPPTPLDHNSPTALYNGMIEPIRLFAIRGAIWYQGESNYDRAYQYRTLFPAMIKDWRTKWAQGDFPFYYVQIAPYNYGPSGAAAELREAQLMSLSVPNTGMAVTMDIGNPKEIHPTNKKDVGHRLALCALAETYGKDVKYSSPIYKSMKIRGNKIILSFDKTYGGLYASNGPLKNFTIAGEDKKFVPARALINGNTIIVASSEVEKPVAVRFAWGSADASNLYNCANLPSSSFRTDSWPGDTE